MKQKNMILKLPWMVSKDLALEVMGQRNVNMAKIRQIFTDIPSFYFNR